MFYLSRQMQRIITALGQRPQATAVINGNADYPNIKGVVIFFQTEFGVLVVSDISGLPKSDERCEKPVFAFHIHSGNSCTGDINDPFASAMTHFNPDDCPHPYHAGDMPPLFGNNGYAFSAFVSNRFTVNQIIGRTVIIHDRPDDFTSQPSGNSGTKIACGVIRR